MNKVVKKPTPEILVWKNDSIRKYVYSYSAKITGRDNEAYYFEGGATSVDRDLAKSKAVYEAIERYSGSKIPKNLRKHLFKYFSPEAVDPSGFIFFISNQCKNDFPYQKFRPDIEIEWVKGFSLTERKKIYIPAFAVYLGYNQKVPVAKKFFPTASCGLAVQKTLKKAILNGIFELIERDAAIRVWKSKIKPPRINLSQVKSRDLGRLISNINAEGLKLEVLLSSQDIPVPSVIGIVYNSRPDIPYVTFGLSAGVDIEKITQKSLEEALMVRGSLEYLKKERGLKAFRKTSSQVETFFDHCLYYSVPERKENWQFLVQGPLVEIDKIQKNFKLNRLKTNTLEKLIRILSRLRLEVLAVDITSDLANFAGLRCTKVIIPGLQQMEINHNYQFLKYNQTARSLNNLPHPFA